MVKLIFLCRRPADITRARYAELLLQHHVPLALRHLPTMRRYVVNIIEQTPAGWEELDSIAEISFDSLDDFRERLYGSRAGKRSFSATRPASWPAQTATQPPSTSGARRPNAPLWARAPQA
jgi:hypothetical protein